MNSAVLAEGAVAPRCFLCNRAVCGTVALCARGFARWLAGRPVVFVLRLVGAPVPPPVARPTGRGRPAARLAAWRRRLRRRRLRRHITILLGASDIRPRPEAAGAP